MLKYPNDLSSIRIADFGTATYFQIEEKSYCGTCIFMAPEMIQNKSYNESVDVWACGIILYILASGGSHPIFNKDMNTEEYVSLLLNFSEWNFTDEFPLLARNLFLKLCKFDKIHRYETLKALRHPWITRSASSSIPETLIESYKKIDMTKKFRCVRIDPNYSY